MRGCPLPQPRRPPWQGLRQRPESTRKAESKILQARPDKGLRASQGPCCTNTTGL